MQKNELAQRLAVANETERKNRDAEIRFISDLENLKQQEAKLLKDMKEQFGVSTLEELRQLYARSSQEDERAVAEFEQKVAARQELIAKVQATVNHVNAANRG